MEHLKPDVELKFVSRGNEFHAFTRRFSDSNLALQLTAAFNAMV